MIALDDREVSLLPRDDKESLARLLADHERLRGEIHGLYQRIETLSSQVKVVEQLNEEKLKLNEELRRVKVLLASQTKALEAATDKNAQATSQEYQQLRIDHEELRLKYEAALADKARLEAQVNTEREIRAKNEKELKDELELWVADNGDLTRRLDEEKGLREQAEEEALVAGEEARKLRTEVERLQGALEEARRLADILPCMRANGRDGPSGTASANAEQHAELPVSSDIDATEKGLATEVLAELRQLRAFAHDISSQQKQIAKLVSRQSEKRRSKTETKPEDRHGPKPTSPKEDIPSEVMTIAPELEPVQALEQPAVEVRVEQEKEGDAEVAPGAELPGAVHEAKFGGEETGSAIPQEAILDVKSKIDGDAEEDAEEEWEKDFSRIEEAWLAGKKVGDGHEGKHFLTIVSRLRSAQPALRDSALLLKALDEVRARVGEDFSYCLLQYILDKRMHRPSLNPLFVSVKMLEVAGRVSCRYKPATDVAESRDSERSSESLPTP